MVFPLLLEIISKNRPTPEDAVWSTFVGHDMRALGESAGQVAVEYLKTLVKMILYACLLLVLLQGKYQ